MKRSLPRLIAVILIVLIVLSLLAPFIATGVSSQET